MLPFGGKAFFPISVNVEEIHICDKEEHPLKTDKEQQLWKESFSIFVTDSGIIIFINEERPSKEQYLIIVAEEGIHISSNE